jgi:hypothetical protein
MSFYILLASDTNSIYLPKDNINVFLSASNTKGIRIDNVDNVDNEELRTIIDAAKAEQSMILEKYKISIDIKINASSDIIHKIALSFPGLSYIAFESTNDSGKPYILGCNDEDGNISYLDIDKIEAVNLELSANKLDCARDPRWLAFGDATFEWHSKHVLGTPVGHYFIESHQKEWIEKEIKRKFRN